MRMPIPQAAPIIIPDMTEIIVSRVFAVCFLLTKIPPYYLKVHTILYDNIEINASHAK